MAKWASSYDGWSSIIGDEGLKTIVVDYQFAKIGLVEKQVKNLYQPGKESLPYIKLPLIHCALNGRTYHHKNLFTGKQARATDAYNPFVPDWFYAGSDGTKVPVNQSTALNYSAVYACCNVKSKDVAMLPWDVYMRHGNLRKLAFWHDQYFLIKNEPNSDMTSFDFRRTIPFDKYWWGDGAVWLERNKSGRPIAHHIIRPWQWEAHKDGKDRWFTVDGIGTVDTYDFIQISNQRGPNELRGNSVVSMARKPSVSDSDQINWHQGSIPKGPTRSTYPKWMAYSPARMRRKNSATS